jgi:hypothetical protein
MIYTENIEANISDAYVLTGANVAVPDLEIALGQASVLIETVSGVLLSSEERTTPITVADAVWVRKAIVFQAAWMIEQYGVLSRQAVSSLSQDGLSVSAPDGLTFVLAPLAKRALNNCSWAKTGTLRVAAPDEIDPVNPLVSDNHPWFPLGVA